MTFKNNITYYGKVTRYIFAILLIFPTSYSLIHAEDLTARQIIDKVDNRYDGDSSTYVMTMILIDRNNNKRVRQLKGFSKDYGKDSKRIIFFKSPADVRNTSYLVYDWNNEDKDDDSWLYLPALRKVKRINSNDTSGSFMGSDFSYTDINGLRYSEWDYTFINKNTKVDGHDAWEILGTPKESIREKVIEKTGYLKFKLWVRKDLFMDTKRKYWVKKDKTIKFFKAKDIREINGIQTAHELIMVSTRMNKKKHSSVIKYTQVSYNNGLDDSMFTTRNMERGL